jgi:hypothetical protein
MSIFFFNDDTIKTQLVVERSFPNVLVVFIEYNIKRLKLICMDMVVVALKIYAVGNVYLLRIYLLIDAYH